jgi:hypothetical protein
MKITWKPIAKFLNEPALPGAQVIHEIAYGKDFAARPPRKDVAADSAAVSPGPPAQSLVQSLPPPPAPPAPPAPVSRPVSRNKYGRFSDYSDSSSSDSPYSRNGDSSFEREVTERAEEKRQIEEWKKKEEEKRQWQELQEALKREKGWQAPEFTETEFWKKGLYECQVYQYENNSVENNSADSVENKRTQPENNSAVKTTPRRILLNMNIPKTFTDMNVKLVSETQSHLFFTLQWPRSLRARSLHMGWDSNLSFLINEIGLEFIFR